MGCPIGSMGFDLAEHVFIFALLSKDFPAVTMRALTDDLCPFFSQPSRDGSWEEQFNLVVDFWDRYDELANPIGIFRNKEKSMMIIPPNAPDPLPIERDTQNRPLAG